MFRVVRGLGSVCEDMIFFLKICAAKRPSRNGVTEGVNNAKDSSGLIPFHIRADGAESTFSSSCYNPSSLPIRPNQFADLHDLLFSNLIHSRLSMLKIIRTLCVGRDLSELHSTNIGDYDFGF